MATSQPRIMPRRGASGAWSRLKSPATDPLQAYGLPSKGETRLNDLKAQENYYNKIVERYMKFCGASGGGAELDTLFASLTLSSQTTSILPTSRSTSDPKIPTALPPLPTTKTTDQTTNIPSSELSLIISSMRKLREAIVSTRRTDTFAQRSYIFLIRACILTFHWEGYHPALLYLLYTIHPITPLPTHELNEFANYQILDLACRQQDLPNAYITKLAFGITDRRVNAVLKALATDNWTLFWRVRKRVDGYQRAVMRFAEEGLRLHALKCLGSAYFTAERVYVERCAGSTWEELGRLGVGWELIEDGAGVVIKRVKKR
ncbi:hypothetical protein EJ08DRAFT_669421 [Tothia fuscella]|uniref:CSN8/PSMD8/EIF3K domain-containing protein n=1 Tax=Tothia fuscella TaxID=1048955 RepID=A0A9P4NU88_9PEZI|nr:hypothetical protein EJ08DRAFT_669421 [Tothia fuscella]